MSHKKYSESLKWNVFADIKEFYLTGLLKLKDIAHNHGLTENEIKYLYSGVKYDKALTIENDDNWLYEKRIMEAEQVGGKYNKSC